MIQQCDTTTNCRF